MQSGRKINWEKNYMRILVLRICSKLLERLHTKTLVMNVYELRELSIYERDRLCGLVVRVPGYRS
jgi:hypothetical protein